jgi:hypothetical protein
LFDNGLIDGNEYMKRLLRLGWNAGDATKHVTQCGIKISARAAAAAQRNRPKPGRPPRQLSVAELCTLFAQELITLDEYTEHMARQDFSKEDSDKLIASCQAKIASKNGKPH